MYAFAIGLLAVSHPPYDGAVRQDPDGSYVAYMVPPYLSNHAVTLEQLPGGTLAAAWFSGVHEEAPGCAIVFSTLPAGGKKWSKPVTVAQRAKYSDQNPVLFFDNVSSVLHLFHSQAPANSGESAAEIWHLQSTDGKGQHWTASAPYIRAPGSFPRNRIIRRTDRRLLFPYYSQGTGHPNWPVMAVSKGDTVPTDASGWSDELIQNSGDLVQPSTVRDPHDPGTLVTFFRDRRAKNIYRSTSENEGSNWTTPKPTVLPNNNAGIEAYGLGGGGIVLAYNPQTSGRDPLAVAISIDGGETWPYERLLQHGDSASRIPVSPESDIDQEPRSAKGNEFSYPSVLQTPDGIIHVMYTYNRETIKYKAFSRAWVTAGTPPGPPPPPTPSPPQGWVYHKGEDSCINGAGCTLISLSKEHDSIEGCQSECQKKSGCVIFDFNSNSGHCYLRNDGSYKPRANPHVTSGCLAAKVAGC